MVVQDEGVVGRYFNIELAKKKLKSIQSGARLIAEVDDSNFVNEDPHWVGGQKQTSNNGFNKFWWSWHDIDRLMGIARKYLDDNPKGI